MSTKTIVAKGDLLIAAGTLLDPNFSQTVVLICENQREGSYGLVLNRPLRLTAEMQERLPYVDRHLFCGGPVQQEVLQIIHPYGETISGGMQVMDGVWIGGDFEEIEERLSAGIIDADRCRFYLGYSGWGAGQLDAEFATGSWLHTDATADFIFSTPANGLWTAAIRRCGKKNPLYRNFPENPECN